MIKFLRLTLFVFLVTAGLQLTTYAQCSGPTTFTTATGSFSDGSGAANYNNNQSCSWLIQTIDPIITLSFSDFELENCCDFVRVYDGTDDSAPLIGQFNGFSIPSPVIATNGAMYVTFITDGSVVYGGFNASYTSAPDFCNGPGTLTTVTGSFSDGSGANNYVNNKIVRG